MPTQPPNPLETFLDRFLNEVLFPLMEEMFDHATARLNPASPSPPKAKKRKQAPALDPRRRVHPPQLTLYDVLGVSPRAIPEVIAAAYKSLAKLYHPDVSKNKKAEGVMKEINRAFEVLGDAKRRAEYDRSIGL